MNFRLALLILVLQFPFSLLIARQKDSISLEMERLNKLGDSLRKEKLKRNSAFMEMLDRTALDIEKIKNEAQQQQLNEATLQAVTQEKKEQRKRRQTRWYALVAFLAVAIIAPVYFSYKKKKTTPQK